MSQAGVSSISGVIGIPITVPNGGTGATSFIPYAVITGGVTSTSPLQSVASVGTAGQVLTSNGAGALPTFQTNAGGDVTGPASATDEAVARFDGITGKLIQDSVVLITNAGVVTGVTGLTVTGTTTLNGAQIVALTVPGAYPYNVLTTDYIVEVDTSSAKTIRLPNAPTTGQVFVIKDVTGSAGANNISLTTVGGAVTIDGATTQTMNVNYGSITVFFSGTAYFIT
jgi:hypothetical protein